MSDASWAAGRAPVAPVAGRSAASLPCDEGMLLGQDRRLYVVHGSVRISFLLMEHKKQRVLSRAAENFRDAPDEARGGADSLERQCENGTPLNFVRAVRGTDGHTKGTTSAEHVQSFAMQCEESCASWTKELDNGARGT